MAQLSDLPLEIILEICSFVRPDLHGKDILDGKESGKVDQYQEVLRDRRNLKSLKSFCRTCKKYNNLRDTLLFTTIVSNQDFKEDAVWDLITMIGGLLNNPGGRVRTRSLHLFFYTVEDKRTVEMPCSLSPTQVRALENAAAAVGIDTTKLILDLFGDDRKFITLKDVVNHTVYLRCDCILGYVTLLLILLLPKVQDLTLVISLHAYHWMIHIWAKARCIGLPHAAILRLKTLAISITSFKYRDDDRDRGFRSMFGMQPSCETPELCRLIQRLTTLKKFILVGDVQPISIADTIEALKKHARTLHTLGFKRRPLAEDKDNEYAIADLRDFVSLEKLWITAALLSAVDESGQKQKAPAEHPPTKCEKRPSDVDNVFLKLPTSLKKLRLDGHTKHLVEDFRRFSHGVQRGDYSINFTLSLSRTSGAGKKVINMFYKLKHQVVVGDGRPVLW
ncbi:hypothetical protein CCHR01_02518 [Colletotrichum chrysophilum]|uniref:F-box domain-containing protein n=1 Tax=Colletotrichum chrysophilum TaxID=1836956 RepID=A0AAD9ENI8_9PEZI|nr:hypothetical protein CCHR01_02518 [Colletotrichum chrysophilum]